MRRSDSRESNLSGSDPSSPVDADWVHACCEPDEQSGPTTGQLKWTNFNSAHHYPAALIPRSVSGQRWGTVRLIQPNYVLTAGHCFDVAEHHNINNPSGFVTPAYQPDPSKPSDWQYLTSSTLATKMTVSFRYAHDVCEAKDDDTVIRFGAEGREKTIAIVELVEYRFGGYDYAIAKLAEDATPITGGIARLSLEPLRLRLRFSITHHPAGLTARISKGEIVAFRGAHETKDMRVEHSADTLGGSSGAGVEGRKGQIGVHIARKCTTVVSAECGTLGNLFIPISALCHVSPALRKILLAYPEAGKMIRDEQARAAFFSPEDEAAIKKAADNAAIIGAVSGFVAVTLIVRLILEASNKKMKEAKKLAISLGAGGVGATIFSLSAREAAKQVEEKRLLKDARLAAGVSEDEIEQYKDGRLTRFGGTG